MSAMKRLGVACAGVLLLTACLSVPVPGRAGPGAGEGVLTWKVIWEKRDPNLAVAADRTECELAHDRFERVREGERILCHWR